MKFRSLVVAGAAAACAIAPATASATSTPQVVAGTTQSTLSLSVPTAATFGSGFAPNDAESPTNAATVIGLSTNPSWTLTASDWGDGTTPGNGHMQKLTSSAVTLLQGISGINLPTLGDPTACANSETQLANAVKVQVAPDPLSSTLANIQSNGKLSLNGAGVVVAQSKPGSLLALPSTTFDSTFYQTIGSGEAVANNCQYHVEVAYTLS